MGSNKRRQYISGISCLVIAAGIAALAGWQFDITVLTTMLPGVTAMNPVTALIFVLCGVWLFFQQRKSRHIALAVLAGIVAVLGFVHFITYFFPLDSIRLDYLLFGGKMSSHTNNLIAPNTAFVFFLSGIAMLTTRSDKYRVQQVRQVLIILGFALAYISILGYIFQIQPGYRIGGFTAMALSTGVVFLVLQTGLFFSTLNTRITKTFVSPLSGGVLLRWLIPLILIFPPLTGYFRLLGERNGLYPTEFGIELNSIFYTATMFVCIVLYASLENTRQINELNAKRELIVNERKFRTLFNTMKDGVLCVNVKGMVIYCNPGFSTITGYSEAELVGKKAINILIPGSERKGFYKRLLDKSNGNRGDHQFEIIRKTGERIWIAIKSKPLVSLDGVADTFIATITDITEDKLKIQDLSAFTASAAHDLNAPLGRILALAELFDTQNLDGEQKMFLDSILATTQSMRQLLSDLLFFSKLGTTQLEKKEVNLNDLVKEICKLETPGGFKGNILFQDLPSAYVNEPAIRQLYTNLVSNAVKYSSKKDAPLIEIGAYQKSGQVVYCIKDNGVGLTADQIQKLFTPFRRFHADFEGNGMGLAIVKRIVEKHGGKIWAESAVNEGVSFYFTLSPGINASHPFRQMNEAAQEHHLTLK